MIITKITLPFALIVPLLIGASGAGAAHMLTKARLDNVEKGLLEQQSTRKETEGRMSEKLSEHGEALSGIKARLDDQHEALNRIENKLGSNR